MLVLLIGILNIFFSAIVDALQWRLNGEPEEERPSEDSLVWLIISSFLSGIFFGFLILPQHSLSWMDNQDGIFVLILYLVFIWAIFYWGFRIILFPTLTIIGFVFISIEKIWNKIFPKSESEIYLANDFRDEIQKAQFKARMWKLAIFIGIIFLYIYFFY